jgi:hypothetical protein
VRFEPKANTTLAKVETAYLSALEAADEVEEHKAKAKASNRFTDEGVLPRTDRNPSIIRASSLLNSTSVSRAFPSHDMPE